MQNESKIGVLMGGYSSERDISLKSGSAVFEALQRAGKNVVAIDIVDKDASRIKDIIQNANIDVAFIALHGILGEDGQIQKILDDLDIAYAGSDADASALALNKVTAQKMFYNGHIKVPKFCSVNEDQKTEVELLKDEINFYPLMVKPSKEGSSLGIKKVTSPSEMVCVVEEALHYNGEVLIEEYIKGREFTVAIFNGRALPVIEIIPQDGYFDYTSKYNEGKTKYVVPAKLPMIVSTAMQSAALKAHKLLRCQDFSRVDFILDDNLIYYLLEINTIPGFTSMSLLPKAAAAENINFEQLCLQIVGLAYAKKKTKN